MQKNIFYNIDSIVLSLAGIDSMFVFIDILLFIDV